MTDVEAVRRWTVVTLTILLGVALVGRLVISARMRSPSPAPTVVIGLVTAGFTNNLLRLPGVAGLLDAVSPGLASLLANVILCGFFYGVTWFFAAKLGGHGPARTAVQHAAGLVTLLGMVAGWLFSPRTGAGIPGFFALGPEQPPAVFVYYGVPNLYFAYACVAAALLSWRESNHTAVRRWRIAFRVFSSGFVLCFVGGPLVRLPAIVARAVGERPPPALEVAGLLVTEVGIVLIAFALGIASLLTVLDRSRGWWRARRRIVVLEPLWRALCERFPEIALEDRARWFSRLRAVPHATYRYRRMLVECRDGLWRLSRYVDPDEEAAPIERQARRVHEGLGRVRAGGAPVAAAGPIAAPSSDSDRDDEEQLLALARAFAAGDTRPAGTVTG